MWTPAYRRDEAFPAIDEVGIKPYVRVEAWKCISSFRRERVPLGNAMAGRNGSIGKKLNIVARSNGCFGILSFW